LPIAFISEKERLIDRSLEVLRTDLIMVKINCVLIGENLFVK
jgi:hypothetical protein